MSTARETIPSSAGHLASDGVATTTSIRRVSRAAWAGPFVCWLLAAACGAGVHAKHDAGSRPDGSMDAGPDATAAVDGGTEYDCEAACSRAPPICPSGNPDRPSCLDLCTHFARAPGCEFGEGLQLIACLEEHPGACEELPWGECWEVNNCFQKCTDPTSELWCRPRL